MLTACPRCKDQHATVRYDFGTEKIVRCASCTLLYLHPWPDAEDLEAVYGDTYFKNEEFLGGSNEQLFGYADYVEERFNKRPQYAHIANKLRRLLPDAERPSLLEVGCGLGYFLGEAFEEGFAVSGLEYNRYAVDRLKQKYAFPIHHGSMESIRLEPGSYDAVTMFDVVEHLRDPFTCLDKIHDALVPGGVLALSTMDSESWVSRLIGKRLEDFRRTREHLYFFSRKTMTEILNEHGFEVIDIRFIGHTFELSFLLDRLALYNRPLFKGLQKMIDSIGLGSMTIVINPLTKMLVLARKLEREPKLSVEAG